MSETNNLEQLRLMREEEAVTFALWEKAERPYPWTPGHFIDTMNSPHQRTLVLEKENAVLGFAAVQIIHQEAYLLNIMVEPLRRGQGCGTELLEKVRHWARAAGAKLLFLDVDPANKAAMRLYQKAGFEKIGRRPHGYPRGEDSVLMRISL